VGRRRLLAQAIKAASARLEGMVLPVGRERLMRLGVAGKVARPRQW
jgi:hypothetical protein